jgi:hypothetical protein
VCSAAGADWSIAPSLGRAFMCSVRTVRTLIARKRFPKQEALWGVHCSLSITCWRGGVENFALQRHLIWCSVHSQVTVESPLAPLEKASAAPDTVPQGLSVPPNVKSPTSLGPGPLLCVFWSVKRFIGAVSTAADCCVVFVLSFLCFGQCLPGHPGRVLSPSASLAPPFVTLFWLSFFFWQASHSLYSV